MMYVTNITSDDLYKYTLEVIWYKKSRFFIYSVSIYEADLESEAPCIPVFIQTASHFKNFNPLVNRDK